MSVCTSCTVCHMHPLIFAHAFCVPVASKRFIALLTQHHAAASYAQAAAVLPASQGDRVLHSLRQTGMPSTCQGVLGSGLTLRSMLFRAGQRLVTSMSRSLGP